MLDYYCPSRNYPAISYCTNISHFSSQWKCDDLILPGRSPAGLTSLGTILLYCIYTWHANIVAKNFFFQPTSCHSYHCEFFFWQQFLKIGGAPQSRMASTWYCLTMRITLLYVCVCVRRNSSNSLFLVFFFNAKLLKRLQIDVGNEF